MLRVLLLLLVVVVVVVLLLLLVHKFHSLGMEEHVGVQGKGNVNVT